ncbi:Tn3 family transposase [Actinoallomurus iriomotensis]|nr:Tn3 family transposase [Actinoallomurus iriomotensis]
MTWLNAMNDQGRSGGPARPEGLANQRRCRLRAAEHLRPQNWGDILRVVDSIYTGEVRAYDVVTMLQRDGHPTALGEA